MTLLAAALLFLISLVFLPASVGPELLQYRWVTVVLIVLFMVALHPRVLNIPLRLLEKLLKRSDLQIHLAYGEMLKMVGMFVVNWLIVGFGFYLLTCSIYPLPISFMPYASGVYALAAIIGILSLFAPSGIGVRDAIVKMGLGFVMPGAVAIIVSIVSRLWATIPELLLPLISFIYAKVKGISYDRGDIQAAAESGRAQKKAPSEDTAR